MEFLLSSDLLAIPELLRTFLPVETPPDAVRSTLSRTFAGRLADDKTLWSRFAELGVLGGPLPENLGGLGMGLLSAVVAAENWSGPINHLPIFQTLCHAVLPLSLCGGISRVGDTPAGEAAAAICERIVSGSSYASGITLSEGEGLKIRTEKGVVTLTGDFLPFSGGTELELIIFVIERKKTADICVLDLREIQEKERGFAVEPLPTLDLLRCYSQLRLENAPVRVLGSITLEAARGLEHRQNILAAAELVGIGSEALKRSIEYVKEREQFGRPIGTFQAIQHSLANMHLAVEQARAITRFAAWCADAADPQFFEAALAAKAFAGENIPRVVEDAIQVHGGMGFTFENDLHFYLRRAQTQSLLLGDARELYVQLANLKLAVH